MPNNHQIPSGIYGGEMPPMAQGVPHVAPQSVRQGVSQSGPQTFPQGVPHGIPQGIPQGQGSQGRGSQPQVLHPPPILYPQLYPPQLYPPELYPPQMVQHTGPMLPNLYPPPPPTPYRFTRPKPVPVSTERTHEENQERAYIAASRRGDRSIEARIQSARQASEIHKLRTGKALRITEEIVRNEEMYEEEEDDFPRSFRALNGLHGAWSGSLQPHMQTANPTLNAKVEAFMSNKVALSQFMSQNQQDWQRENEVNRAFAEAFPNVGAAQRMPSMSSVPPSSPHQPHGSMPGPYGQAPGQHQGYDAQPARYEPVSRQSFGHINYNQPHGYHSRGQSFSSVAPGERRPDMPSPPALTPGSQATTPQSQPQQTPYLGSFAPEFEGAFTSELPNEAKMFMDPSAHMQWDPSTLAPNFNSEWSDSQQFLAMQKLGNGQEQQFTTMQKLADEQEQDQGTDYPSLTPQPVENPDDLPWSNFLTDEAYAGDEGYNVSQNQ